MTDPLASSVAVNVSFVTFDVAVRDDPSLAETFTFVYELVEELASKCIVTVSPACVAPNANV